MRHHQSLRISSLFIEHNGQQFALASDGWELRGFVGSWSELERHLLWYGTEKDLARDVLLGRAPQVGLAAKLLKDSGERDIKGRIRSYTGKEQYEFGDVCLHSTLFDAPHCMYPTAPCTPFACAPPPTTSPPSLSPPLIVLRAPSTPCQLTKVTMAKVGEGMATGISTLARGYTGKEEYEFGDLTKVTMAKVSEGVKSYTGKEYEFGDLTKVTMAKVGEGVATGISSFTGKPRYAFGDVSKTVIAKIGAALSPKEKLEEAKVEKAEVAGVKRAEVEVAQVEAAEVAKAEGVEKSEL